MTEVDWRRAFMRLVASYMHEELNTSLDIVDLSPRINDTENLSEDTIIIRATLNKETTVSVKKIIQVMNRITESLEFPHIEEYPNHTAIRDNPRARASFQGDALILTFRREPDE